MPIHPRQMASGPQGRVWQEIADIKRELSQIREARANQVQRCYAQIATEESLTTSISETERDLATEGPICTVSLPDWGAGFGGIGVAATVEGKVSGPISGRVNVKIVGQSAWDPRMEFASTSYETRSLVPGSNTGVASLFGGIVVYPATTGDTVVVKLNYGVDSSGLGTATFRNRRLWVFVL